MRRKQTNKSNKSMSIDGFTRAKKSTNSVKQSKQSSSMRGKSVVHKVKENDYTTFPGLKSTFQKPLSTEFKDEFEHKPKKAKSKLKIARPKIKPFKIIKRLTLAAMLFMLLAGSWLIFKGFLTVNKVFKGDGTTATALSRNVDPSALQSEGDGRVNILILGKGGDTHDGGELTDSMIVASIDPLDSSAALLSIPRDLYVDVPGLWSMKINAAYSTSKLKSLDQGSTKEQAETAGLTTIKNTVEEYFGIPLHYHLMIDFIAFEQAVDALGGVDVNVTTRLYDSNFLPTFLLDIKPGRQTFDGSTTLFYIRSRYTSPRGDFDRSQRQREVLVALKEKVLSVGTFSNPLRVAQLLDVIGDNVKTNISLDEMLQLYDIVQSIEGDKITSLSLVDDPVLVHSSFVGDQSVVIPIAGRNDYTKIKSFVRNELLDGYLKKESATVVVLNGSGVTGAATRKANELKSYGYDVVEIGDAETADYLSTILYDTNNENPYTKQYLERRLGVVAASTEFSGSLEVGLADFVIIVGANEEAN